MIKFLNWVAGLRPTPCNKRVPFEPDPPGPASFSPKPPPDVAAVINRKLDRDIAAGLDFRRGSNPPAPGSKPEPPAEPFDPVLQRSVSMSYAEAMKDRKQAVADLHRLRASAPPSLDGSLQRQVRDIWRDMQARALAEQRDASLLWEIAESLAGFVVAEQGSIPATTDNGQILVTPPKPQPTGGRLIRGDVDPGPVPSPLLLAIRSAIDDEPFGDEPRAVLLVVAQWLHDLGHKFASRDLKREAGE